MKTIKEISDAKCVGCTACKSICPMHCIEMKDNAEGFLVPDIAEERCVHCGKCYRVCPTGNVQKKKRKSVVLGMINRNFRIRNVSSSGGVFYELAKAILFGGGVVCGSFLDEDMYVRHIIIDTHDEIELLTKSKYVQSDLGSSFAKIKKYLDMGRSVLFVGTPCQVQGLGSFLGRRFDNLYLVDLVCHGVPSPKVWEQFVQKLEEQHQSKCLSVSFRDITIDGWKNFGMKVEFANGDESIDTQDKNIYMFGFLNGYTVRKCCFECQFKGNNRNSDITIGDFWSVDHYLKHFNDNKGTSLVYINTDKGFKIIKQIRENFYVKKVDYQNIDEINTAYLKCVESMKNRNIFFKKFIKGEKACEILTLEYKKRRNR